MDTPRYWYSANLYRWWARWPVTWEGWLADAVAFLTFIAISPYVKGRRHPFQSLTLAFGLLALFLAIRRWKGEPND